MAGARPRRAPATERHRPEWRRQPERGHPALLGFMAAISLKLGRRIGRLLLHPIALWYLLFAPRVQACLTSYLDRALGRRARLSDRRRHLMSFAATIQDRLYLMAGRDDWLEVSVQGAELVRAAATDGGALLFGAHMGSFEVLRVIGRREGLSVAMAMYEENARKLHGVLSAAAAEPPQIIAVGQVDSVLKIRARLEQGGCVGILADRRFDTEPTVSVPFLGALAPFPTQPMRLAALLGRRVLFMVGLYQGGNRYQVAFEPLADFGATPPEWREREIVAAVARYAARLEHYCRSDPYNWFNFYDFWAGGDARAPAP